MPSQPCDFVPVVFYDDGGVELPTSDGRRLRITEDSEVGGLLALRNETGYAEEADEELPTDVLAAELRIADAQGRLWRTTSSFSANLLVARMVDLSDLSGGPSRPPKAKSKKAPSPFDSPSALKEILVSSDDRFYRYFTIDGKTVATVQFKYTVMTFDAVLKADDEVSDLVALLVRLREGSLHDRETGEELGELHFSMRWAELLRCNTHKQTPDGEWKPSTLPHPLVFEPLDESAAAQEGVVIL